MIEGCVHIRFGRLCCVHIRVERQDDKLYTRVGRHDARGMHSQFLQTIMILINYYYHFKVFGITCAREARNKLNHCNPLFSPSGITDLGVCRWTTGVPPTLISIVQWVLDMQSW